MGTEHGSRQGGGGGSSSFGCHSKDIEREYREKKAVPTRVVASQGFAVHSAPLRCLALYFAAAPRPAILWFWVYSVDLHTEKEARDLIKVLLTGLKYLHECGIVHRDIKPENLLMTSPEDDADIKFADFGFARRVLELAANEKPCGTPNYVAPEVLRKDKYGCEPDIWSLGVVCYILLVGYPPFEDEDQKVRHAHMRRT